MTEKEQEQLVSFFYNILEQQAAENQIWVKRARSLIQAQFESKKNLKSPIHLLSFFNFHQLASNCICSWGNDGRKLYQFISELPGVSNEALSTLHYFNRQFTILHTVSNELYCHPEDILIGKNDEQETDFFRDVARFNGCTDIDDLKNIYLLKYNFPCPEEPSKHIAFLTMMIQDAINKADDPQSESIRHLLSNRHDIIEDCQNNGIYLNDYKLAASF